MGHFVLHIADVRAWSHKVPSDSRSRPRVSKTFGTKRTFPEHPRTMCTLQTVRILKPRFYFLFISVSSEIPGEMSEGSEGLWICWHSSFKLYLSTGVRMYVVQCKSTPFQQQTNLDSCFKESTSAIHLRLFWTLSHSVTRCLCCNFMF